MALGRVMRYLNEHKLFAPLPSFEEVTAGLVVAKRNRNDTDQRDLMRRMEIPTDRVREKERQFQQIASHLFGGHDKSAEAFQGVMIDEIVEIGYASTHPLRVTLALPGGVKQRLYVKRFDEQRLVGLELENILGPYKYPYSSGGDAIYEAEIPGKEAAQISDGEAQTPEFRAELVGIDFRSAAMLIGDMNPGNYLVEESQQRHDVTRGYRMRPIDFDKLFSSDKIRDDFVNGFIITEEQRAEIVDALGRNTHDSLIEVQRQGMRKRYLQQERRMDDLFELVGDSDVCNREHESLAKKLSLHYDMIAPKKSEAFYETKDMGQLLRMHLAEQLHL